MTFEYYHAFPPKLRYPAQMDWEALCQRHRDVYEQAVKDFVYGKCQGNRERVLAKVREGLALSGRVPIFLVWRLWYEVDYEEVEV